MGFLDLFDSGFRQRNQDHFAAIVRVAMSDGVISGEEKAFLDKLADNLQVSPSEYQKILKDYMSHPINPPTSYDRRLERLYDLSRMVYADHHLGEKQTQMLERLGIGLGFSSTNIAYIVDKALKLVQAGVDLDNFRDAIRNMNR
jgi:uncharacterized tellurite resistance protein B-like protein